MNRLTLTRRWLAPIGCILATVYCATVVASPPRVFLLDSEQLVRARQQLRDGDAGLEPALKDLKREAHDALSEGPFSVVNKPATPPSGDKHDYMSLAPYWWPNPDTPDGLPYIHRDGERNPAIAKLRNREDLGKMAETIETLALAYYFTGDEKYAARVRLLLRTWFINAETRMNPNFNYAQGVRGHNTGRGQGLIESRLFMQSVEAVGLIAGSPHWTDQDELALRDWFSEFLNWMLTSRIGRDEGNAKNNHGTYYDLQVAVYALYLDNTDSARQVLESVGEKRIAVQIEPDGRQPLELARTKAWSYSIGNLSGLMRLAALGERLGVDLWHYETEDGRSIRVAIDFLVPFGLGEQQWPYQQIDGFSRRAIRPLLRQAAVKYPDAPYRAQVAKLPRIDASDRANLLTPLP
ncbi:MAG: alginate lyase family protein [Pirellulales bacterium]